MPPDPEAFVRGWLDAFNRRDWEAYGAYFTEDVTYLTPGREEPLVSRAAHLEQDRKNAGNGRLEASLIVPGRDQRHLVVEGIFRDGEQQSRWVTILELRGGLIAAERLYFDRS
ncbi:MAG TPA: nuclear transport factor 2 family protein [Chloroflexota bacterium]